MALQAKTCKNTIVILLDNAGWVTSEKLNIFVNVNRINQSYLSKNETSRHPICFNLVKGSIKNNLALSSVLVKDCCQILFLIKQNPIVKICLMLKAKFGNDP